MSQYIPDFVLHMLGVKTAAWNILCGALPAAVTRAKLQAHLTIAGCSVLSPLGRAAVFFVDLSWTNALLAKIGVISTLCLKSFATCATKARHNQYNLIII